MSLTVPKWALYIPSRTKSTLSQRFSLVQEKRQRWKSQGNGASTAPKHTASKTNAHTSSKATTGLMTPAKAGLAVTKKAAKVRAGKGAANSLPPRLQITTPKTKKDAAQKKTKKELSEHAKKQSAKGKGDKQSTKAKDGKTTATSSVKARTPAKGPKKAAAVAKATQKAAAKTTPKGMPAVKTKKPKENKKSMTSEGLDDELIKHRLQSVGDSGRTLLDRQLEDFCNEQDDEFS